MRLTNGAYERIKTAVVDLLEDYGVRSFPLDVCQLIERMGIRLIPYSELDASRLAALRCLTEDAMSVVAHDYSDACIFYDDAKTPERVNYTLAHELGHIVLEHDQRRGDRQEAIESEADFFAAYLLMPVPVVLALCGQDPREISEFFGTSLSAAINACNRTRARVDCGVPPTEYELRLVNGILASMRGGDGA